MGSYLMTVEMLAASGVPNDSAFTDWAFSYDESASVAMTDIGDALESFYTTTQVIPGTDHAVTDFMGAAWKATPDNVVLRLFDLTGHLDGSPHGSPVATETRDWDHAGANSYPTEVACTLSFHADLSGVLEESGATRPRARRRGRVYIPFITQALTTGGTSTASTDFSSGQARPSTSLRDTLAAAGTLLAGALDNAWSVWSRSDAALRQVTGGWVDDAFDTQRRRGPDLLSRTVW